MAGQILEFEKDIHQLEMTLAQIEADPQQSPRKTPKKSAQCAARSTTSSEKVFPV